MLGAIIGDVVGSRFEFNNIKTKNFKLFQEGESVPTDDSTMTVAIMDMCVNNYLNNSDRIIDTFKKWGRRYPNAGYGGHFFYWVLGNDREPYNSYGNGAAMRVSPIGWIANSKEEVVDLSRRVTEVTHNHPEGIKGAETTAMMIFMARNGATMDELVEYALNQYPEIGELDYEELRRTYFHGEEICQLTLPQALYCFLISNSFEDCLRTTISIGGDCDTTASISCAIAEAYYGIPEEIKKEVFNFLPNDMIDTINKFYMLREEN